jgi:parallel beta-helix repeat protein
MKHRITPLFLLTVLVFLPAISHAADRNLNCSTGTITDFLPRLRPGDRLLVTGTCNENVSIDPRFNSITLEAQGAATINGPDATANTVLISGKGITIKGFTITGGSRGIIVSRGGSATIDGNTIQNTGSDGIQVSENGTARIINNTIQNNPDTGISIFDNSSAHIGFERGTETTASPNTIQNNATRGILISNHASARIVGNTINGNGDDGIGVARASQAAISSNSINNNAGDGIFVSGNSHIQLGADTGSGIFDLPNSGLLIRALESTALNSQSSTAGKGQLRVTAGPRISLPGVVLIA